MKRDEIEEAYVSFDIAKWLRKKGYNEMTESCYGVAVTHNGKWIDEDDEYSLRANGKAKEIKYIQGGAFFGIWNRNSDNGRWTYSRPSISIAMRWLREKHNLFIETRIMNDGRYIGLIFNTDGCGLVGFDKRRIRQSYEGACEVAIKYCLEHLI